MPLIKRGEDGAAEKAAREMRRTADRLDRLTRVKPTARQKARARAHPEMERIARRVAAINTSLATGVAGRSACVDAAHEVGTALRATGGRNERGSGIGRYTQGRVRDDIGRETQAVGYQRPALHRLGGLPRQGIPSRSEPAVRLAEYELVRAGDP